MKLSSKIFFASAVMGTLLLLQSSPTSAFSVPTTSSKPRFNTRLVATVDPTVEASPPPSLQTRLLSRRSRSSSPLFSSTALETMASSVVPVSLPAGVAMPVKRGILSVAGIKAAIAGVLDNVASSKAKCWTVLVLSVLLENVAATLSKKARDTANPQLFVFSLSLNLIR